MKKYLSGGTGLRRLAVCYLFAAFHLVASGLAQTVAPGSLGPDIRVPVNTPVKTISAGSPLTVIVSSDSKTAYVMASPDILVLDATNNWNVKAQIPVPGSFGVLTPNGQTLYVSAFSSQVTAISTVTNIATATISGFAGASGLAVTSTGKEVFVADRNGTILVIDTETNQLVGDPISVGGAPEQMLISKDGKQVEVLNEAGTGALQFVSISKQPRLLSSIGGACTLPEGMALSPDGQKLYVANVGNYVAELDAQSGRFIKEILAVPNPFTSVSRLGSPALTLDAAYMYVPYTFSGEPLSPANQVAMIDIAHNKIVGPPIPVGEGPIWLSMAPNGDTLYVTNYLEGSVTIVDTRSGRP
jgi:YVTN family beta-propeller protein